MKVAGTVTLYYPDEEVLQNINSYLPLLDLLIISDNSQPNATALLAQFENDDKIVILRNKENEGIALPLNNAAQLAIERGFDWLLTMDQDSKFNEGEFGRYLQCVKGLTNLNEVGALGVNTTAKVKQESGCGTNVVSTVITSGTMLNLKSFRVAGRFDERLFIDGVDDEYCFRLQRCGYKILQFNSIYLDHHLGNEVAVRNLGVGKKVTRNVFSAIRLYYMVRNYHLILKEYGHLFPEQKKKYYKELFTKGKNAILYGPAMQTIKYLFEGYRDFLLKRYGKYR